MSTLDHDYGNQRSSPRVPYAARMMVVRGASAWLVELQDLSEGGCGIFRPSDCKLEVGDVVRLFFFEHPGPALGIDARVARVEPRTLGFEYHDIQSVPPARV